MKVPLFIEVDDEQFDRVIVQELRRCYVDHRKHFSHEPNHERLTEALLTVIEHYSTVSGFEEWYETIKEL